jgi:hypothetical protein
MRDEGHRGEALVPRKALDLGEELWIGETSGLLQEIVRHGVRSISRCAVPAYDLRELFSDLREAVGRRQQAHNRAMAGESSGRWSATTLCEPTTRYVQLLKGMPSMATWANG